MSIVIFAVVGGALVLAVEWPSLWKRKQFREMAAYGLLTAASLTIYSLQSLHVQLPNPLDWIASLYRTFGLAFYD